MNEREHEHLRDLEWGRKCENVRVGRSKYENERVCVCVFHFSLGLNLGNSRCLHGWECLKILVGSFKHRKRTSGITHNPLRNDTQSETHPRYNFITTRIIKPITPVIHIQKQTCRTTQLQTTLNRLTERPRPWLMQPTKTIAFPSRSLTHSVTGGSERLSHSPSHSLVFITIFRSSHSHFKFS